ETCPTARRAAFIDARSANVATTSRRAPVVWFNARSRVSEIRLPSRSARALLGTLAADRSTPREDADAVTDKLVASNATANSTTALRVRIVTPCPLGTDQAHAECDTAYVASR